jgi:pyruvate/2-oxoglutarate/acetoin dehydrogenase E1 component
MTYQDKLHKIMLQLAKHPRVVFIGYNTKCGHQMYGTLKGCEKKSIEMPVAENLMTGVAMGMALEGWRPVLCFERMDFILPAMDALINHMDKLPKIDEQVHFPIIVRCIVGSKEPLYPGVQHVGDYTDMLFSHTSFKITNCFKCYEIDQAYKNIDVINAPRVIVEYKDLYPTFHGVK